MLNRAARLLTLLSSLCLAIFAAEPAPSLAKPQARILASIDEAATVALSGNVHPLALSNPSTAADAATPMEHMILYLKGDATQEAQLTQLVAQQSDPKSPLYGHFLAAQDFAAQFGVAESDIQKVAAWLQSHGFTVEPLPAGNRSIVFSGTASQAAAAFKTEIRQYSIAGKTHYANASDPQIPAALAGVVGGIVKLHNFPYTANILKTTAVTTAQLATPQLTSSGSHYLAPADYGTIYDINPLYTAGINGTGQSIAVIARSNINVSDVASFRSQFGLPANNPQIVLVNSDPGVLEGDSTETTLDTEWSGAIATHATIKVIVAASTNTADGIDLSALYAVNNNVAPIITLSYGSCEADMGSSELSFYNSLWRQAAAEGISVMVAAGDSGAAGCYGGSATSASGKGINGLCSSPYSTCVGGTEFNDGSNPGQDWLPGNNAVYGSAIGYIPETVWNESGSDGGSGLWAGGGGASIAYTKPAWQTGPGVPADGQRDVPDVSLTASGHDGYLIVQSGSLYAVGGTSAATPSFAAVMALVDQKTSSRQGLANTVLYPLAANQASGGAAVFHDTLTGNNSVPGVTGFSAAKGYDLGSGLGSVDANLLVNNWTTGSASAALSVSVSPSSLTVDVGKTSQAMVTTAASSSLQSAVTLSVTGLPAGVTAALGASTVASPGSGSVALTISATSSAKTGTYSLTVTAAGGGKTATTSLSVVIVMPTFTLSTASAPATVSAGNTAQVAVTSTPQNGFSSAVALSVMGLPSGATGTFSPASIGGATAGTSTLTFTVAKTAHAGSYPLSIAATGGGVTQSAPFTLVITTPASCTMAANPSSVRLTAGQSTTVAVSCGSVQGTFTAPLALSVNGAPSGLTVEAPSATLAPGASTTLTLISAATISAGSYNLLLTAIGSGFSQTLAIPLAISAAPATFHLTAAQSSIGAKTGNAAEVVIETTPENRFSSTIALSVSGLPTGAAAVFSPATIAGATAGASTLTLTIATTAKAGSYPLTITATGGGITQTAPLTLTIIVPPACTLAINPAFVQLSAGESTTVALSCGSVQGTFATPLILSLVGAPAGLTVEAPSGTLAAGSSMTLTMNSALTTVTGSYKLSLTASGSGFTQTLVIPLTIMPRQVPPALPPVQRRN